MATKKPSVATQLKNANIELAAMRQQVEKLTKDAGYNKSLNDNLRSEKEELQNELDQLHGLLDAMEGTAPRKTIGKDRWGSDTEINNKAMTRLASWLAKGKA